MSGVQTISSWALGILFLALGLLNAIFVHPVPGIFYFLLSFAYFPPAHAFYKRKFGFTIPFAAKVIVALVVLWGTLAVTDLAEMAGL